MSATRSICIIPARGGSKGIPRKNLVPLGGKPLLVHSIEQARCSKYINRVIVSTEDEEIKEVALQNGAEVPFMRPEALAQDHVLDLPVFEHVIKQLQQLENYTPDIVVHLRPTAPYRKAQWIDKCIELLMDHNKADSVRSVSPPDKHPYRMFKIDAKGFLDPIMKHEHTEPYLLRRQDLPPVFYYNCVIDVTRTQTILQKHSMTGNLIFPYVMKPEEVLDIDTPMDLEFAKYFFEKKL